MKTMYMHTLDGKPAYFDQRNQMLYFISNETAPLATDLKQIRREQKLDTEWCEKNHSVSLRRGYVRVGV